MIIRREKNPDMAFRLMPFFIPYHQTPEEMAVELNDMMKNNIDETFVIIATENGICKALIIAYTRPKNKDVWLWQGRAKSGFRYSNHMMNGIFYWTKSKGYDRLSCGVNRRTALLLSRKYGFIKSDRILMERKV